MNEPLDTLWYTNSPAPTGLGIAAQTGRLAEAFRAKGTSIQDLRGSGEREVRQAHFNQHLTNSVRHGSSVAAIWAHANGNPTHLLGVSWCDEVQLILTTAESGVSSVRDLKNRRFGLPKWANVQIDFTRAQALRSLENALRLEGLEVADVELVDYPYGGIHSDDWMNYVAGTPLAFSGNQIVRRNNELIGLLRGDIDAIFLKGAGAVNLAREFGLHVIIDTGSHPEPLVRANNGTPRTLTVDHGLIERHYDSAVRLVDTVLRAEQWAWAHPEETCRLLAREMNTSERLVIAAHGEFFHRQLRTSLDEGPLRALQDFADFLLRWRFIDTRLDVGEWIDARPLHDVLGGNPVRLVR